MKPIASIDPGQSGGYAVMTLEGTLVAVGRLKTIQQGTGKRRLIDALHLRGELVNNQAVHVVIEDVWARPASGRKQGGVSSGTFMKALGVCYGVAATVTDGSVSWVLPQVWKRHFGLLGKDKEASRQLAISKFGPEHFRFKKDTDKAEACLIALWYVETKGKALLSVAQQPTEPSVPATN